MDLRNLMNDDGGNAGQKKSESHNPPAPAPLGAQPSTPSQYSHPSQQQTPLYPPPSAGGIASRPTPNHGMTPLRAPSQTTASAQYPFPSQTQPSPVGAAPGQSYRPFESQPPASAARPGSHGQQYQTSQSASYASQTPVQQHHSYASISPTPPSHLSRTPTSMRQSPMATISQLPTQQHTQYSQPNTPLGPPQHYPQRAATFAETHSPYHQRSASNASNGVVSGSPAQHHPGIPNLVESPSAYARPSPRTAHSRQASEYASHSQSASRERSISVSPKTKPPPRPPSLGSRQSSSAAQDIYSARASEQYNHSASLAGSPHHVTSQQPPSHPHAQHPQSAIGVDSHPHAAADVAPPAPALLQQAPNLVSSSAQSSLSSQTGSQAPAPQPSGTISHQNEKMGMSHLVTPASEVPPQVNGHSVPPARPAKDGVNVFMKKERSATPKNHTPHPPPPLQPNGSSTASPDQVMTDAHANGMSSSPSNDVEVKSSLKRPASSSNAVEEPPSKHLKHAPAQKVRERPVWARLSQHNPRFKDQGLANGGVHGVSGQPQPREGRPRGRQNQPPPAAAGPSGSDPIDTDMKRIRNVLGDWERTFNDSQPMPDIKRAIADWFYTQLAQLQDIGTDPHLGTVEIEAKIGTLFDKDSGDRINLPVMNSVILSPSMSDKYRFESRMQEFEHLHMNQLLNAATKASLENRGRVAMEYKHFVDIDSFKPLSQAGIAALPPSVRARLDAGRTPRLRTTVRHKKGEKPYVSDRIVKVNVGNLQIYSPNDPYDLRISINIEANLMQHSPQDLIAPERDGAGMPDRRKDRISYNHLVYQIDLTRVDVGGDIATKTERPVYELELEVDSVPLRRQMANMQQGREAAFGDLVAGFWDNAVLLMRERAVRPPGR